MVKSKEVRNSLENIIHFCNIIFYKITKMYYNLEKKVNLVKYKDFLTFFRMITSSDAIFAVLPVDLSKLYCFSLQTPIPYILFYVLRGSTWVAAPHSDIALGKTNTFLSQTRCRSCKQYKNVTFDKRSRCRPGKKTCSCGIFKNLTSWLVFCLLKLGWPPLISLIITPLHGGPANQLQAKTLKRSFLDLNSRWW